MGSGRDFSKSLGYVPDLPDHRDLRFSAPLAMLEALPSAFSLRRGMPDVYDQGDLGSCTANAIAAAMQYLRARRGLVDFIPSRLAIYYDERAIERSIGEDAGAMIRDGIKVVNKKGVAPEERWPYDVRMFRLKPPDSYYKEAEKHQALLYRRVDNTSLEQLKAALATGHPVVGGVSVYTSFFNSAALRTGTIGLPKSSESLEGGHAILFTGYSDTLRRFRFRNSWGARVGKGGYFSLPYSYVTNSDLADDFWIITEVEDE